MKYIKKLLHALITCIFTLATTLVLTGTITGTAAAVYLLGRMESAPEIKLKNSEQSSSSYIYTMNSSTGEYELAHKITPVSHDIRIYKKLSEIPDYVKSAFLSVEDERFYSHEGVDYIRTGGAVINLVLNTFGMGKDVFGGSTVTQQLIKNITKKSEQTWERKMDEIFSAMNFEKRYTKDEILEGYLNEIYFSDIDGYHMYGIEAASIGFFGKSADELSIAEAASLAAMPKSPNTLDPADHYEENMKRKNICLYKMFELGIISADQYEEAKAEKILVTNMPEFSQKYSSYKKLDEKDDDFENSEITSWPVDRAIIEFSQYLCDEYGYETPKEGRDKFFSGGYSLYLSADMNMQAHLDSTFSDWTYFPDDLSDNESLPEDKRRIQAGLAVVDYHGNILALEGNIGPKTSVLCWNNATDAGRQPGSAIKPVSTYGYALENDLITWSSYFYDSPLDPGTAEENAWPMNYGGSTSGQSFTVDYFLKKSLNTLPAQIVNTYGKKSVFDFAAKNMHLDLDPVHDMDYSPLCVGGTNTGPSVLNLANSYIPYGNGGTYYKAGIISKATDCRTGEIIFDKSEDKGEYAVSEETSYIMNRLLQKVINEGTGTQAQLADTVLAGKTGTTENWRDITFVGMTPDYVSAIWIGYPNGENAAAIRNASSSAIWKKVFGTYADEHSSGKDFPDCDTVLKNVRYCSYSGKIANPGCPGSGYGYYKSTDQYCDVHNY